METGLIERSASGHPNSPQQKNALTKDGKRRRLLRHPILAAVMYLERIAVGFTYLLSR